MQDVLAEEAGRTGVQRAPRQLLGDGARRHAGDAHRRAARREEERDRDAEGGAHPAALDAVPQTIEVGAATYCLAALSAAWSRAPSSWVSDVLRILPPVPLTSSRTRSGVALVTRTNRAELFGGNPSASSFLNLSSIPTSLRAPLTPRAVAPTRSPPACLACGLRVGVLRSRGDGRD